jgi:hypothetical protein
VQPTRISDGSTSNARDDKLSYTFCLLRRTTTLQPMAREVPLMILRVHSTEKCQQRWALPDDAIRSNFALRRG